ncbi:hypothetical protein D3C72_2194750 [compost metagenome]
MSSGSTAIARARIIHGLCSLAAGSSEAGSLGAVRSAARAAVTEAASKRSVAAVGRMERVDMIPDPQKS